MPEVRTLLKISKSVYIKKSLTAGETEHESVRGDVVTLIA